MAKLNMVQAINLALKEEMERDPTVLVLGEDVGKDGGVFRVTEGLWEKFGDERVIDTPLSESGIVGTAIGLSLYGFRPVPEIQFCGFVYPAFDQLISHAARFRTRTRGRFSCPMVVRVPYGGGIRAIEHHSESMESIFVHTPGLKVVIPSTPFDAKGLLTAAIRDPDPVIFYEPKRIYRAIKEEVSEENYAIRLGKAKVVREGSDVTFIAWGAMVRECERAADALLPKVSAEVIDVRTLYPFDTKTIIESVKKTGRAVIVHEAPRSSGFGAEIASQISEKALLNLRAPVERVTGYDTVMPYYKMEDYYLPDPEKIIQATGRVMKF
jgi:pyruvate dehydrogenase E1 component beta subunit